MLSLLTLIAFPLLQDPGDKPDRQKPLVPAPEDFKPRDAEPTAPTSTPKVRGGFGNSVQSAPAFGDSTGPRNRSSAAPLPFHTDRPLLRIDGITLSAAELNEMVAYYRTFRSGSDDLLLQDAVNALLPMKTMQAHFADQLPTMRQRIDQAREAVVAGTEFAVVVAEFSQDGEAPTPDGSYTFGREVAVQPFDRVSHSTEVGDLSPPFLTVYGYHFIEMLEYERGAKPAEDRTTMRHVLVMYPELAALDEKGEDIRKWIKKKVKGARIEVLEHGMGNLVPAENRSQVVGG